jgi:hypothetical protein
LHAKAAQRAATELKEAEARSAAAKLAWKNKMEEARRTAIVETEKVRKMVELKISSGAEAALIQAEAKLRAKTLRETAYQEAISSLEQFNQVITITEEANKRASARQFEQDDAASQSDITGNANRMAAIWYEAYMNHTSTAAFETQQAKLRNEMVEWELMSEKLTVTIGKNKQAIADAKFKLEAAEVAMAAAETEVNIQIEVQARHRMATDSSRKQAEKEAKSRARVHAANLQMQAEALSRATTLRIEGHMKDMKAVED